MSRWMERPCNWCHAPIPYLPEWTNIPAYCRDCNEWQYKTCGNDHCGGTIQYKVYWNNIHEYCNDCKGWYEKKCDACFENMRVHSDWTNVPQYCKTCNSWQEKACANNQCNGKVRYKAFWDHIPEYCSCKGWYEKACENPHCSGTIRVHASWTRITKYCSCNGWYDVACANRKCTNFANVHLESKNQDTLCKSCYKMSRRRDAELCAGTDLEEFLSGSRGISVRNSTYGPDYRHISIYVDGGHVSADVHIYSTECLGFHYTLDVYNEQGNKRVDKTIW